MSEQGGPHRPGNQAQPEGWRGAGRADQHPQGPQNWQPGQPATGPQGSSGEHPTGPRDWSAQQPAGPQGWQQPGQHNGNPQGWQQPGQHRANPQGWQQPGQHNANSQSWSGQPATATQVYPAPEHPAQGYPAQGNPAQGYPAQGPGGPNGPDGPYVGQQPAPAPKNRTRLIVAAAVVVALIAAAGIYLLAIRDSNDTAGPTGQATPQASVTALFETLGNSDPIGLADQLDPAESALFTDLNTDIITELKRLEVLSSEASADSMTGTTITVSGLTMDGEDETINDHLRIVKLTGGTVTVASDPSAIPLSESFKAAFGDQIDESQPESQTVDIADAVRDNDGEPIRVATVQRGDQWYVSLFYTIADNAVHEAGLPNPTSSIPAEGKGSPEEAVNAFIEQSSKGDIAGVIALLPPDEMGVMHDYGQVIIDEADGTLSSDAEDLGLAFSDVTWDVTDVTGGKKLSVKTMTVTADGETATIETDAANGSLTITLPDQPAVTLNEDTIDTFLADATGGTDLDQQALDIIKREFKQVIGLGIVTVEVDGQWYISPIRSVSDIFVSLLKGLEPGDVDYLINLSQN